MTDTEQLARRLYERWASALPIAGAIEQGGRLEGVFEGLAATARTAAEIGAGLANHPDEVPATFLPLFRGISPQPSCCGGPMKPMDAAPDTCAYACPSCGRHITVRALVIEDSSGA